MRKGVTRTAKTYMKNGKKHRLTPKAKKFSEEVAKEEVKVILGKTRKPKSGTAIAQEVYNVDNYQVAAAMASENLKKPEIMAYKDNYVQVHVESARKKAEEYAPKAVENIINIAETATSENTKLEANKEITKIAGVMQQQEKGGNTLNIENMILTLGGQKRQAINSEYTDTEG